MTSTFAWLAHSRREREQTLELLARLREQEVREELGLGAIRDAFSDQLFPGLSTVQTRAAYFLLVPWCYEHVARTRNRHRSVDRQVREVEIGLISALLDGQDLDGVIGQRSRAQLQRLPSEVYWNGLLVLGIVRQPQSRSAVHAVAQAAGRGDVEQLRAPWDEHLPAPPDGFPEAASLGLRATDAAYLRDRISRRAQGSLLEHLVLHQQDVADCSAPWDVPSEGMAPPLARLLEHARAFSLVTHGSALLYNLMLAELVREEWAEEYRARLASWQQDMDEAADALGSWDRDDLWRLVVVEAGAQVTGGLAPSPTRGSTSWWHTEGQPGGRPARATSSPTASGISRARPRGSGTRGPARAGRGRRARAGSRTAGPLRAAWSPTSWSAFVLQPSEQTVLFDALRPPEGYPLDRAVAATFSLDLVALLSVPLAFSLVPGGADERSPEATDPAVLLESVRRVADRLTVFCQTGQIGVPRQRHPLLGLLEERIVEVKAPRGGLFHPKLWVLRYDAADEDTPAVLRVLVSSRNLTFDRSWDTALVLEGVQGSSRVASSRPLADLVRALPSFALRAEQHDDPQTATLADAVARTSFPPPESFSSVRFLPLGWRSGRLPGNPMLDEPRSRVMVVSPFLGGDGLARAVSSATRNVLVSRREALDALEDGPRSRFGEILAFDEGALPEQDATDALVGLHAKLYVTEYWGGATIWTGSANATHDGFSRNVD